MADGRGRRAPGGAGPAVAGVARPPRLNLRDPVEGL
ncbi:hypothetical protein FRAHR75_380029 [Frankia sp. Hr75.2]|nr:hypothetical protein FRAHR75_380029 [Frankia sp. Hr75.2]SQD97849.1 hypothetical protein FMEAI12_4330006 [Parafrankia sp. Ea1.12]